MSKYADFPYLPSGFDPEEELLDQLSNRPGNQRCVVGRDELLLVVHEVPKPGIPEREPLIFWRRADETWLDYAGGKGLRRLGDLLDRYAKVIDEKEELIEEADTAGEISELVWAGAPLARSSRNLMVTIDHTAVHDAIVSGPGAPLSRTFRWSNRAASSFVVGTLPRGCFLHDHQTLPYRLLFCRGEEGLRRKGGRHPRRPFRD